MSKKRIHFPLLRNFFAFSVVLLIIATLSAAGISSAKETVISQDSIKTLGKLSKALSEVAEAVRPAVVNISTTSVETMEDNPLGDMFNDPYSDNFSATSPAGGIQGRSENLNHRPSDPE